MNLTIWYEPVTAELSFSLILMLSVTSCQCLQQIGTQAYLWSPFCENILLFRTYVELKTNKKSLWTLFTSTNSVTFLEAENALFGIWEQSETKRTRKRASAKAMQLEGHPDFAPVDLAYYQHFLGFLFENIAFCEVPPGNHKCRSRGTTPLPIVKYRAYFSVQLMTNCAVVT